MSGGLEERKGVGESGARAGEEKASWLLKRKSLSGEMCGGGRGSFSTSSLQKRSDSNNERGGGGRGPRSMEPRRHSSSQNGSSAILCNEMEGKVE